jgi:hypothetical protein
MERTFRPKGTSVKAVQVNVETIDYAADWCSGVKDTAGDALDASVDHPIVKVPTLEGVKLAKMGDYIVRVKGEGFKVMSGREFEDRYEPVRTTRSDG